MDDDFNFSIVKINLVVEDFIKVRSAPIGPTLVKTGLVSDNDLISLRVSIPRFKLSGYI